ncbi:hypothetical protein KKE60_07800 [Patescibacteria group bacterium]|nr:hypothetical protein [Patescibacteria group bacterium]
MSAQIALIIVGCIVSALLTFTIFYFREIKESFEKSQTRQDEIIDKIRVRLDEMPEKYVLRDDFVRWSICIDKKIDELRQDMKRLIRQEN